MIFFYVLLTVMILLVVFVLIRSNWEIRNFVITEYNINADIDKKCRLVLLSDLHSREFGDGNEKLLRAVDELTPDIVCIAGDMVVGEKKADFKVASELLEKLCENRPVFYVYGNHEGRLDKNREKYGDVFEIYLDKLTELTQKGNLYMVNNQSVEVPGFDDIIVSGLDLDKKYYSKRVKTYMDDSYIESRVGILKKDKYNILLSHHPKYFENYASYGPQLVLSGHYHGGTVRLPKFGGVISTDYQIFPENDKGIFKIKNTEMIVSGGLGCHTVNFRLFNLPELVVVNLNKEK